MPDSFVHLHLHTEYSMLDGASRIGEVVAAVAADGQPAVGITDHGNMYGALELYKAARAAGIKPVLGMEGYFTNTSRFDRPKRQDHEIFHLTLLAETDQGYRNLIKVTSQAYLEGYYYKPRSDWELLAAHREGISATTGCLGGLVSQLILQGQEPAALEAAARLQDIFGRDHFFVELQDHGIEDDAKVIRPLLDIARKLQAPLLATNDSHYTTKENAEAHDALLCVQTGALQSETNRLKFEGDNFYIKSAAEMRHLFREVPEACDNTLLIAERAALDLEFGNAILPSFPVPEGHDENSYLRELTFAGAQERYGPERAMEQDLAPHVRERLDFELDVIKSMGFSAYFLVVWDLVRYAKSRSIRVGPGRGSAAGSCVAFCLRIVDIDPIRYDLLFERFLNPGRKEMPDIDMDFDSRYRGEMIRYAAQKYGDDHVAQVVTFSTIKARAAVRDAARVLGYPYALGDKVAKLMPPLVMGRDTPLHACFEKQEKYADGYKMAGELRQLYEEDPDARRSIDVALGLEGLRRQDGIHAAAVVITRDPLTEYLPIQRKPEPGTPIEQAPIVTQYEMNGVQELGLLKMDFLGLRNLDVMEIALALIETSTGVRPDIDDVALDDPATFELLRRAETIGVFQLEGGPMRTLIRSLAPARFEDVCALVALYRPGPMGSNMHNEYADRANGRKPIVYYHQDLEEILAPTHGLMIYQEQLMRVAQKLAGYTLEEADNLRKAAAKKKRDLMRAERSKFVAGCERSGYATAFATQMFDVIEPFADYSFPKAHATGYGLIAYQTAWLKANFPVQYLAALLTSVKTNLDKAAVYLNECRLLDIPVLVPDVNASVSDFSCEFGEPLAPGWEAAETLSAQPSSSTAAGGKSGWEAAETRSAQPSSSTAAGGKSGWEAAETRSAQPSSSTAAGGKSLGAVRFGLSAVRNVGEGVSALIIRDREERGPFTDFHDFCDRVDPGVLNKRTIESLVRGGAFDSLGHPRRGLGIAFEQVVDAALRRRREREQGTMSLFDLGGDNGAGAVAVFDDRLSIPDLEFDKTERLRLEKEMLGLYVSEHPLMGTERALRRLVECSIAELADLEDGAIRTVAGVITALSRKYTRRGDLMATFVLEDIASSIEVMVFPKTMALYSEILASDTIVTVKGRVDGRDDAPKLMALEVVCPEINLDAAPPVRLRVKVSALTQERVATLKSILAAHPGESPVFVHLVGAEKETVLQLGDEFCCNGANGLFAELRILFGAACIL